MTHDERIKFAYKTMIKNNPDEAVKVLIMQDKKIKELEDIQEDENEIKYLGQDDIRDYIMKKDYEIYKLQQRINKAIEYINDLDNCKNTYANGDRTITNDYIIKLLNILRGEDNE